MTTRKSNFRILNPILATTREIAEVLNRAIDGKLYSTGQITLTASSSTSTVNDTRASKESVILFSPTTSNAASAASGMHVSTKNNGSFVVTHASNSQADRTFDYVIIG